VLQILINLIRNAKYALDEGHPKDKELRIRVRSTPENRVQIRSSTHGVGIPPENLTCIFQHGFTTRKDGHGFGLPQRLASRQGISAQPPPPTATDPGTGPRSPLELPQSHPAAQTRKQAPHPPLEPQHRQAA